MSVMHVIIATTAIKGWLSLNFVQNKPLNVNFDKNTHRYESYINNFYIIYFYKIKYNNIL